MNVKKIVGSSFVALGFINTVISNFIVLRDFWGSLPTLNILFGSLTYYIGKLQILTFLGFFIVYACLNIFVFLSKEFRDGTSHFRIPKWFFYGSIIGGFIIGFWQMQGMGLYSGNYSGYIDIFGIITVKSNANFIRFLGFVTLLVCGWFIYYRLFVIRKENNLF